VTQEKKIIPYKDSKQGKKEQVAQMFDNIAHKYDFLNHFLSLNIDKIWRKKAIKMLKEYKPQNILDVATGTGDLAINLNKHLKPEKITGIDISVGMLKIGKEKIEKLGLSQKIELLEGDSEKINFPDNTFDAVTVAFGVRNFENLPEGLKEMNRVTKIGGTAVVLEFSKPETFPVKQLYTLYFKHILPSIGKLFSKDTSAYSYLPESVDNFPYGKRFISVFEQAGFSNIKHKKLTFGIAAIYKGEKK
jgi:demethylmenaquinone methyltransferase/2-methoxy-6-polyprenyl-1,4-benzoquinol methylase